jgi:hypothetical protein
MSMPISVLIPDELRTRLEQVARKRTVGVSTAIRTLVEERLAELDLNDELRAAEAWQREQVLATWAAFETSREVVSWDEMEKGLDEALDAAFGRRSSRRGSHETSKTRSRGLPRRIAKSGRRS